MVVFLKETKLSWVSGYGDSIANRTLSGLPSLGVKVGHFLDVGAHGIFFPLPFGAHGIVPLLSPLFFSHTGHTFHHSLGNGSKIRFGLKNGLPITFKCPFRRIFNLFTKKSGDIFLPLPFKLQWLSTSWCNLHELEIDKLSPLLGLLSSHHPKPSKTDSTIWSPSPNGLFSVPILLPLSTTSPFGLLGSTQGPRLPMENRLA